MSSQNITLKFKDVIIKEITCDAVTMGKDIVPLIRYGNDKKTLNIQGPWIKMRQYGIPPGETLSNGIKNDFYLGEESRLSIRFPIDISCCVQTDPENNSDLTNCDEIQDFTKFLQALDNHIKSDTSFMTLSDIDIDNKEKYTNIYRKPVKAKKNTGKEIKEKYHYMKTKLNTTRDNNQIKTEFYTVNNETKQNNLINNITLKQVEDVVKFNSEVLPIFQLVKIWTQTTGAWGVTLKLMKIRVRNQTFSDRGNAEFIDSDNDNIQKSIKPKSKKTVVKEDSESDDDPLSKSKIVSVPDSDSDNDIQKPIKSKKKIVKEESDNEPLSKSKIVSVPDSDSDDDVSNVVAKTFHKIDDDESDDDVPLPPPKAVVKPPPVEDSDSEEEKPKKVVKKVIKAKK